MEQENQEMNENSSGENRKQHYKRPNQNQNSNKSPNTQSGNKNKNVSKGGSRRRQSTPTDEKLKAFVELNQESHRQRLNPHYKLDLNSRDKVRITPLGGLSEIGGNITVFETQNEAILVDVGMSFPDEDMHGVDILIPDFNYLRQT